MNARDARPTARSAFSRREKVAGGRMRGVALGRILVFGTVLTLLPLTLKAQLASDEVPRQRTVARAEEIKQQLEDSRWHLGGMRVRPIFGLHDLGYDNNVNGGLAEDATGDWRGTVSAGADLLLPMGNKMYLTGTANPEYTYYQKTTSRRTSGGIYGGSILALFNHLNIEAGGSAHKQVVPVSPEIERAVPNILNEGFARGELDISRRLSLFGSVTSQQQRYEPTEADIAAGVTLEQIERDEAFVRGGVRYKLRSYFDVSLAAEQGHTDFRTANASDNETKAVILGIHYDRPRFFVNLSGGQRSFEPYGSLSIFPKVTTPTGSYFAEYQLGAPVAIDVYGDRRVQYSVSPSSPYFLDTHNGLGFTVQVGERVGLRAFGETGSLDYQVVSAATGKRTDNMTVAGGGISYRLYRKVILTIVASQTRYDSNLDQFDRSIFRVSTFLSIRGDSF